MQNLDFMTISEVAEILRLSKVTVNRLIHRNELHAYKFGRAYRIPKDELERYLNESDVSNHKKTDKNGEEFPTIESLMKHFGTWAGGKEDAEKVLEHINKRKEHEEKHC